MTVALIIFPTLAILAGLALVATAPTPQRLTFVLPAIRTVALVTTATIYTAALFHGAHP